MESGKRSKNFTEREKMLLIEVAKEFVSVIDNKKTDATTVDAKKQAWIALTNKYNAASETGVRTEKQLHALYDNLKKKARKNLSDDKCETYKTGGGTFCPKTTVIDEEIVALLTPQFKPLPNEFDSSAPYYLDNETQVLSVDTQCSTPQDILVLMEENDRNVSEVQSTSKPVAPTKRPVSPCTPLTSPKRIKSCLTDTKKKSINNLSASIIKRKNLKQLNEDLLTNKKLELLESQRKYEEEISSKKLEILELQRRQEFEKLEKTKILLDIDIELKKILLESAKLDLEFKKKNFSV